MLIRKSTKKKEEPARDARTAQNIESNKNKEDDNVNPKVEEKNEPEIYEEIRNDDHKDESQAKVEDNTEHENKSEEASRKDSSNSLEEKSESNSQ